MKRIIQLFVVIFALQFSHSIYSQNFVKVTRSNASQIINLTSDQVLEISLPRNPSSGFAWYEASSGKMNNIETIEQSGDWEFVPYNSDLGLVGQSGDQIIRYVGISEGTTILRLEYKRAWEKNVPAVDEYTVTIESEGKYTGSYTPPVKLQAVQNNSYTPSLTLTLPTSFSWQSQCTPIKDQGQCGSCWTFAGTGFFEADIKIIDGNTRNLSEQCLINCSPTTGDNGCNGGYCPASYWVSKGAVYESDCPYVDYSCQLAYNTTSSCINSCGTYPYHEKATSGVLVPGENSKYIPPVDSIKKYIYNYGPVWIAVDAASNGWDTYAGGIWVESVAGNAQTDHAVVLVGWKDTTVADGSGGYWILRNSWNTDWGIKGYMHISYASDLVGSNAEYLVYKGIIPQSVAPVAHFAAIPALSCTGIIQFTDSSTNVPTTWSWNFGDGGTSTLENPSHTYTSSGSYTVSLTATNSYGNNTLTKTSYVSIDLSPTSPIAPNVSRCGPGTVTLNASGGSNSNYYWYDGSSNLLSTSSSYTTPSLTTTTSYYVEDLNIGNETNLSAANGLSTYFPKGGYGLLFNITNPSSANSLIITALSAAHWYESTSLTTQVYYRTSTYVGNETSSTGWTQVYNGTSTSQSKISITNFTVPPNGVYGVYIYVAAPDTAIAWTGAQTYSNNDMTINAGSVISGTTAAFTGGTLYANYSLFGVVYYKTVTCVSSKTTCEAIINTPPTATASSNSPVCTGSTLSLTGAPSSMASYTWSGPSSFSNSTQSPTVSASATTAMAGTYTLTATDANGCSGTASTTVIVNTTPSITATNPASRCGTGTVTLSATASAGTINWYAALTGGASLGTGTSFTTPSISVTTTYYVATTNGSCTSSPRTAVTATVNTLQTATATSNSPVCVGSALTLTGGPGSLSSYSWSGPNSFSNSTQSPTVSASATTAMAGTYIITVTNANGCTGTASTVVTVSESPTATASNNGPVCTGSSLSLTGGPSGMTTYAWGGPNSFSNATQSPSVSASATTAMAGTYTITVTNSSGCSGSASTVVMVNSAPNISGQPANSSACAGSGIATFTVTASGAGLTYQWQEYISSWNSLSNGGVYSGVTTSTLTITNPPVGMNGYMYRCVVSGTCSPNATSNGLATLTVHTLPTATVSNSGPVCKGSALSLTGGPGSLSSYDWSGPNSFSNATQSPAVSLSATAAMAGTYTITVTDANGCNGTASTAVIVNTPPTATASNNGPVCAGSALSLTGGPGSLFSYAWSGPNSFANGTQSPAVSASATAAMAGTYTITATDANGCTETASTAVTVNSLLPVSVSIASSGNPVCSGTIVVFTATPVNGGTSPSYQWSVNSSNVGTNSPTYSYTPANLDAITCVLTSNATCPSGSPATSNTVTMTVNVNIAPSVTASNNTPVCTGSALSLTGEPGSMTTYAWAGPNSFSNATQSPTVSASATTAMAGTYSLTVTDANGCSGTASTVVAVNTTPTITSTTPATRCGTGTVTLSAAFSGTINWYAALTGGSSLSTGTSFTTPSISTTTTYYVDATTGNCTSTPRIAVVATVNTPPTATAGNNGPVCNGSALSLTGGTGSLTYAWSGPNSFSNATQSPTVAASATAAMAGTYTITVTDGNGCTGTASTVVTVNATPTITSTTPAAICGTGTAILGAVASAGTINWYATLTGGVSLGTGTSFTTPSISTTTTYYVAATNGSCTSSPRTAVTATVNTPPTVTAANNGAVCSGSTLSLTGGPASMTTYAWSGPNSFSSASQSPTVSASATVAMAGTYTITVTNSNGCSGTASTVAVVNATPTITSTTPASRCGTGTVTLGAAASAGTINWYAALTGGASLGTGISYTTASISATTTYYVAATNGSCTSSPRTAVTATVNTPPTATASNNGPICSGNDLTLTGGPGSLTSYAWTGPNSFSNATQSPIVSATATTSMAGTYTITVTDANGCTGTASTAVTVNATPTITVTPASRCGTGTLTLGATASAGTPKWYAALTGGGSLHSGTTYTTPSIFVTTTYYVASTSGSCTTSPRIPVTATVNTLPTASATNNGPVCAGSSLSLTGGPGSLTTYDWSGPNTFLNTTQSPTVSANATTAMTGTYTITVTDGNGCTGTASTIVTVNANPTVNISASANPICDGSSTTLTASGGTTYSWSSGLGTANPVSVSPVATTSYTVTGTTSGCTGTTSITVTVNPNPTVSVLASSNPICDGSSTTLTASGGTTYSWSGGLGTSNPVTVSPTVASTYTVTGTTSGCTGTASITINTNTPPLATADNNGPVCANSALSLTGEPVSMTTYAWSGPNSFSNSTQSPSVSANATTAMAGTYILTVTDANGCTGTASTVVTVNSILPVSVSVSPSSNPVCSGTPVVFTATPTNGGTSPSYQWKVNGANVGTNSATYSYSPANLDAITCILTSNAICPSVNPDTSNTVTMTVNVSIAPTVTANSNSPVCTGSSLSLTGGPGSLTSYAWSGPNSFSNFTQSPTVSATATTAMAGTYSITVTDANGCSGTASTVVVVNTTPSIISTTPASRCRTGTVTLGAASSGTINWYAALTGGASLGTGSSFTTPSISTTATYYVDATTGSCTSSPRIAVIATVNTPPTATASNNGPVCTGSTLSLTGGPGSLTSYAWSGPNSFSNATQSPAVSASATTAMAGTYTITVTDANGCSGTASTVVVVNTTPSITSTTPASRCGTGTVNLSAASSGTINWYAALTGGVSLGTDTSFTTPSISATTTYYVDATTGSCTSSPRIAVIATVNTPPTTTASNNGPVCSGSTLSLTGGSGSLASYAWSGPNSFTNATQSPTISASATTAMLGTYTITVTDANGCSGTASTIVTVNATPTITSTTPASRCGTGTVNLGAAASAGTINWYAALTGGASLGTGTSYTTPSISATTTYYVAATNGSCTSSPRTAVTATVNTPPTVAASNNGPVCSGTDLALTGGPASMTTYVWSGPNYFSNATQSPTVSATATTAMAGTYTITVTDANGCTSIASTVVIVNNPPTVTATSNNPVCTGSTLSLTGEPGSMNVYTWSGPNSFSNATQSPTVSASASTAMAGTYSLTVTDANGCSGTASTVVVVNTTPSITSTTPASRCGTGTVNLGAASLGTINWYAALTGGASLGTGTSFTTPSISVSTTYYVDATSGSCTSSPRIAVIATVNTSPTATASNNGMVCTGSILSLTGGPASMNTYTWSGPNSFSNAIQSPEVSASATSAMAGTYTITVTDANGCSGTASTVVTITTSLPVSVSIAASANPVCNGMPVTFTATPVNGGTSPTYQWKVNTNNAGTNSTTYSFTPANLDAITCKISSNVTCPSGNPATSNTVTMTVNPLPPTPVITQISDTLKSNYTNGNQWYYNDISNLLSGAVNQFYIPYVSGNYFVIVTDSDGCASDSSNIINVVLTGIVGFGGTYFDIFPNPSNGLFNVTFDSKYNADATLTLIDAIGQPLIKENLINHTVLKLDISYLPQGMYFMRFETNKAVYLKKVLVIK